MYVQLTPQSGNEKTGPIPVSMTDRSSCPDACPFKKGGCYGRTGNLRFHVDKIPQRGVTFKEFCKQVRKLHPKTLWRHNQVGDLPGIKNKINKRDLRMLVAANLGRKGFTYTHKPLTKLNKELIKFANSNGFVINLSANNPNHADYLKAQNVGPVCLVVPEDSPKAFRTPAGHKVCVCPAQQCDTITCANCKLCAKADRQTIIAFRAHGKSKKLVSQIVKG